MTLADGEPRRKSSVHSGFGADDGVAARACARASRRWGPRSGSATSVASVEAKSPPTTPIASGRWGLDPPPQEGEGGGEQAEDRAEGRHHDGPEPPTGGRDQGVSGLVSLRDELLRLFDEKNDVFHDEAHEKDEPHDGGDVQRHAAGIERENPTRERQRNREENQKRCLHRPELRDEDREHCEHSEAQDLRKVAKGAVLALRATPDLRAIAPRQREFREPAGHGARGGAEIAPLDVGCRRYDGRKVLAIEHARAAAVCERREARDRKRRPVDGYRKRSG